MTAEHDTSLRLAAYVLDCADPRELAEFYSALLGWAVDERSSSDEWVELRDPRGGPALSFQAVPESRPSTWPTGERPQMAHLDIRVSDVDEEHERAVRSGATQLPQPPDRADASWRVYADPAGHPFCLCGPPSA